MSTDWESKDDFVDGENITKELTVVKMAAFTNIIVCQHKMQNWK